MTSEATDKLVRVEHVTRWFAVPALMVCAFLAFRAPQEAMQAYWFGLFASIEALLFGLAIAGPWSLVPLSDPWSQPTRLTIKLAEIAILTALYTFPSGRFVPGQKVMVLVGGMGRGFNGSYAELASMPASNVVSVKTDLSWEELAAIPWSPEGRIGLASLYLSQGRTADARTTIGGLVTSAPEQTPDLYATVVQAFTSLGDREAAHEWMEKARQKFPNDRRFR